LCTCWWLGAIVTDNNQAKKGTLHRKNEKKKEKKKEKEKEKKRELLSQSKSLPSIALHSPTKSSICPSLFPQT
jgi:hypothetical protein